RRTLRLLGTLMIVAGTGTLAWALLVWQWQDPFTAAYTHYEQRQLTQRFNRELADFRPSRPVSRSLVAERRAVAADATRFRHTVKRGQAIGRIRIPRIGLNIIVVNGTDHDTLKRGPGRDLRTFVPGQGQLVYVAGHRTTYLAPFSHIDQLRKGDRITLELPYATFEYAVTGHRIVVATNLAVLKSHGHEELELQACHPRFFATHRYIVYAKPVRVTPRGGQPYAPGGTQILAAAR
ncbi:MAG: sortase, partial [Gaiellaceae bacterium]